jgi:copper(I)-binding protein
MNTTSHTATLTHTQIFVKSVSPWLWAAAPTAKLQAAYMPTANTVDQRRTSVPITTAPAAVGIASNARRSARVAVD